MSEGIEPPVGSKAQLAPWRCDVEGNTGVQIIGRMGEES